MDADRVMPPFLRIDTAMGRLDYHNSIAVSVYRELSVRHSQKGRDRILRLVRGEDEA
jgi:hypothetical protein